jgi:hypothetical protein
MHCEKQFFLPQLHRLVFALHASQHWIYHETPVIGLIASVRPGALFPTKGLSAGFLIVR